MKPGQFLSRRQMLQQSACGFGALAFAGMCEQSTGATASPASTNGMTKDLPNLLPKRPMFASKAKRVIFIFMQGGPSHVDSLDYKPELIKNHGKNIDFTGVRFNTFGKASKRKLLKPLWKFRPYGESGKMVSDLFPWMGKCVDDLCMIHSMHTEGVAHGPSTLFMHTGATNLVRPSIGSWITYGLGTENQNIPGFITINPSSSKGGPRNYSNAFLPTIYQGTAVGRASQPVAKANFRNIKNKILDRKTQQDRFDFLQQLNQQQLSRNPADDQLEATVKSYELAFRMQNNAPEIMDLADETDETKSLYGIDQKETEDFGRQCLLARRMAEAGVRYIQINYSDESTNPRWDQHSNMKQHAVHAKAVDKPVAGLLADLKRRGLLEDTLVWWGGEFGRTPFAQGADGRDHNPRGFTVWLAGGGTKPGYFHGETDEIGHHSVTKKVHMHDLHATILHLLGVDHKKLTYNFAGRNFRLTDVHGRIVDEIIA